MIETLMGLPGRVSALLNRLTDARASNLDRLDAAITSRAPSGTALTNLVWTDAIAQKLARMHVEVPPTALPEPWVLPAGVVYAGSKTDAALGDNFAVAYSRTGPGSLRMLALSGINAIRVTIDGIVVLHRVGLIEANQYAIWGHLSDGGVLSADTQLPFGTSLLIETQDWSSTYYPGHVYHVIVGA